MFPSKTNRQKRESESRQQQYYPVREDEERAPEANKPASTGRGFMAELDQWLDENVFEPIERAIASEDTKELHIAFAESKQQIKRKVLASYHNGLKAKSAINYKTNGQRTTYRRN
jgi:hypothetical protein